MKRNANEIVFWRRRHLFNRWVEQRKKVEKDQKYRRRIISIIQDKISRGAWRELIVDGEDDEVALQCTERDRRRCIQQDEHLYVALTEMCCSVDADIHKTWDNACQSACSMHCNQFKAVTVKAWYRDFTTLVTTNNRSSTDKKNG